MGLHSKIFDKDKYRATKISDSIIKLSHELVKYHMKIDSENIKYDDFFISFLSCLCDQEIRKEKVTHICFGSLIDMKYKIDYINNNIMLDNDICSKKGNLKTAIVGSYKGKRKDKIFIVENDLTKDEFVDEYTLTAITYQKNADIFWFRGIGIIIKEDILKLPILKNLIYFPLNEKEFETYENLLQSYQ